MTSFVGSPYSVLPLSEVNLGIPEGMDRLGLLTY